MCKHIFISSCLCIFCNIFIICMSAIPYIGCLFDNTLNTCNNNFLIRNIVVYVSILNIFLIPCLISYLFIIIIGRYFPYKKYPQSFQV